MKDMQKYKRLLLHLNPYYVPYAYSNNFISKYPFTQIINRCQPDSYFGFRTKCIVTNPIKDIFYIGKNSFDECCYYSVKKIENTKGPVYVKWSGGTDSTLALLCILRWGNNELKDRLRLLCSSHSFKEFPELIPLIKENFTGKVYSSLEPNSHLLKDGIIVNGEFGDQLFGSSIMGKLVKYDNYKTDILFNSYQNKINIVFKLVTNGTEEQIKHLIDFFEPTVKTSPIEIKTIFDYLWWFNFVMKAQHVLLRDMVLEKYDPNLYLQKNISFFYSKEFELWSLDNHHKKIGKEWKTYKLEAKKLITKLCGIQEQEDRIKGSSRPNILRHWRRIGRNFNIAIDEDLKYINNFEEESKYLANKGF